MVVEYFMYLVKEVDHVDEFRWDFGCLFEGSQVLDHSYLGSSTTEIEKPEKKSYIVKQKILVRLSLKLGQKILGLRAGTK